MQGTFVAKRKKYAFLLLFANLHGTISLTQSQCVYHDHILFYTDIPNSSSSRRRSSSLPSFDHQYEDIKTSEDPKDTAGTVVPHIHGKEIYHVYHEHY